MDNRDLIRFVPAGSEQVNNSKKKYDNHTLTGEEAKAFYEDIVSGVTSHPCEESSCTITETLERNDVHEEGKECNVTRIGGKHGRKKSKSDEKRSTTYCCTPGDKDMGVANIKQEVDNYIMFTDSKQKDVSGSTPCTFEDREETHKFDKDTQRTSLRLLHFAQNGDLFELKRLLKNENNVNIDFQDRYGWTALMCAAVSRHIDVLKFLLSKGANKYIVNHKDQNVLELCEYVGAVDATITINTFNKTLPLKHKPKINKTFFCEVCKREFQECTPEEHSSSTVHLFNLRLKPRTDQYLIPENNRGFQMMKKSGWDGEKGLGPDGLGHKYPVKTKLKRDRQCLGTDDKKKAKVTHFGPKDCDSVKSVHKRSERILSAKMVSKRQRTIREQKDKQWERNLRTYMNSDF